MFNLPVLQHPVLPTRRVTHWYPTLHHTVLRVPARPRAAGVRDAARGLCVPLPVRVTGQRLRSIKVVVLRAGEGVGWRGSAVGGEGWATWRDGVIL